MSHYRYACYCILEHGSDASGKVQHFSGEIDAYENDDATIEKHHPAVNDKEARGMTC